MATKKNQTYLGHVSVLKKDYIGISKRSFYLDFFVNFFLKKNHSIQRVQLFQRGHFPLLFFDIHKIHSFQWSINKLPV